MNSHSHLRNLQGQSAVFKILSPKRLVAAGLVFVIAFAVYYLTAYRTITWWNNAEEAVAAFDLGVMSAPGGVISTLLGWVVCHLIPASSDILALNLFAGFLGAVVAAGILLIGYRVERLWATGGDTERRGDRGVVIWIAAIGGALSISFGETLWHYAVQYTTYIVTPVFTVLILAAMIRWWERGDGTGNRTWLFVTTLLFGLDISVHRTNALLLPGLAAWILLGHPRSLLQVKTWLAGVAGLLLGLSFHLVVIPMAAAKPFMNIGDPSTIDRFWSYVTLEMRGGGFLVNLYPRNADFWTVQVADWWSAFSRTFATTDGPLGVLGLVPMATGIVGLVVLIRRSPRLGVACGALFFLTVISSIVYFNIPENYFRSLHRHYLPSLVIFGILVVVGAINLVRSFKRFGGLVSKVGVTAVVLLLLAAPYNRYRLYYHQIDGSDRRFAQDYAANMLAGLQPNAVLLTTGDNDTFPLWYLQVVEGVRPDVTVLNIPLLNTGWFVSHWKHRDAGLRLDFADEELDPLDVIAWRDTIVTVPVTSSAEFSLPDSAKVAGTIGIPVKPTAADAYLLPQDRVILRLVQNLKWERPIYTVATLGPDQLPWLQPYLRPEGLVSRVLPIQHPPVNPVLLARNLTEIYRLRDFVSQTIPLEPPTAMYAHALYVAFGSLITAHLETGNQALAQRACNIMFEALPPDQVHPREELVAWLNALCSQAGTPIAAE